MFQPADVVQLVAGYAMRVGWWLNSENERCLELVCVINWVGMRVDPQHPKETGMGARIYGNWRE